MVFLIKKGAIEGLLKVFRKRTEIVKLEWIFDRLPKKRGNRVHRS